MTLVVAITLTLTVAGCTPHPVGPARTFDKYEGKARTTAEGAVSAVEALRVLAEAAKKHNLFGPYAGIVASEQEDALSGLQSTFDSIQPPGRKADRVKTELDALLSDAADHASAVRVAARRNQLDQLAEKAAPLGDDSDKLQQFLKDHGG
jgi:hypothetical protein